MDFVYDQLEDGRSFRLFNVIDDFNLEALGIKIDFWVPSERVIRALKQIIAWRGKSQVIRYDRHQCKGSPIGYFKARGHICSSDFDAWRKGSNRQEAA